MSTFTRAAISYHGIPPDVVVRSDVHTGEDGVLYITVQIPIMDEDMGPIVKRMGQLTEQTQESPAFVPDDDLQMAQWRDDYSALSPQEKGKYKSFQRYKAHRMAEQANEGPIFATFAEAKAAYDAMLNEPSEGVGGRKVQHIDVAEEQEAVSELPAAVWLWFDEATPQQAAMASDRNDAEGRYLVQVDMLTPEQKAKYCGEQKA